VASTVLRITEPQLARLVGVPLYLIWKGLQGRTIQWN
jgi:hypothetical protein